MSPTSFAVLSGAGIIKGKKGSDDKKGAPIYTHTTYDLVTEKIGTDIVAVLTNTDRNNAQIVVSKEAPIYPVVLDSAGAQAAYLSAVTEGQVKVLTSDHKGYENTTTISNQGLLDADGKDIAFVLGSVGTPTSNPDKPGDSRQDEAVKIGDTVRVDLYEAHYEEAYEMSISADNFPGYYYIEASTLFRDEATGQDLPAEFIIPRGKVQGNFTFTMANNGDPSSFTFTIDCFPAYTKFNRKKKVQAVLQVISQDDVSHNYLDKDIIGHGTGKDGEQNRTKDSDVNEWYTKSIFDQDESATPEPE